MLEPLRRRGTFILHMRKSLVVLVSSSSSGDRAKAGARSISLMVTISGGNRSRVVLLDGCTGDRVCGAGPGGAVSTVRAVSRRTMGGWPGPHKNAAALVSKSAEQVLRQVPSDHFVSSPVRHPTAITCPGDRCNKERIESAGHTVPPTAVCQNENPVW